MDTYTAPIAPTRRQTSPLAIHGKRPPSMSTTVFSPPSKTAPDPCSAESGGQPCSVLSTGCSHPRNGQGIAVARTLSPKRSYKMRTRPISGRPQKDYQVPSLMASPVPSTLLNTKSVASRKLPPGSFGRAGRRYQRFGHKSAKWDIFPASCLPHGPVHPSELGPPKCQRRSADGLAQLMPAFNPGASPRPRCAVAHLIKIAFVSSALGNTLSP